MEPPHFCSITVSNPHPQLVCVFIENSGGNYCIPPKSNAVNPWDCDWYLYKERHFDRVLLSETQDVP